MIEVDTYHIFNWNHGGNHFPTSMMVGGRSYVFIQHEVDVQPCQRDPGWWMICSCCLCPGFALYFWGASHRNSVFFFEIRVLLLDRLVMLLSYFLSWKFTMWMCLKYFEAPRNPLVSCWSQSFPAVLRVIKFWDALIYQEILMCFVFPHMSTQKN